jgi:hypothetical protein
VEVYLHLQQAQPIVAEGSSQPILSRYSTGRGTKNLIRTDRKATKKPSIIHTNAKPAPQKTTQNLSNGKQTYYQPNNPEKRYQQGVENKNKK